MGLKSHPNLVSIWKKYWDEVLVPACCRAYLTDYLSSAAIINQFADDPTKGFLKPKSEIRGAPFTDDDYVGLVTQDQYKQIEAKINQLYSGTGTETATAAVKAFRGMTVKPAIDHKNWWPGGEYKWEGLWVTMDGMQGVGLHDYLPRHTSTSAGPDNKSAQLSIADIILGSALMSVSNIFKFGSDSITGFGAGARGKDIVGSAIDDPSGYIILHPKKDKPSDPDDNDYSPIPTTQAWVNSHGGFKMPLWAKHVKTWSAVKALQPQTAGKHLDKKYKQNDALIFYTPGAGKHAREIAPWQVEFIARIARNHEEVLDTLVDEIIDNILADILDADPKGFTAAPPAQPARPPARKKAGREEMGKYGSFLKPFDLQCFLMENINLLSSTKEDADPYKYLGKLNGHSKHDQPGNLVSYIQHANRDSEVQALLETCPDVYALLSPYIRLYRVDYRGDNTLYPFRETEIPFPNFIDPKDISLIGSGLLGRVPGAGIKSFSWSLDGTQPAEVDFNISANLTVHFQTIQDLFSLNRDPNGMYRAGIGGEDEVPAPGYLDLIIGSGTSFLEQPVEIKEKPPSNGTVCDVVMQEYDGARFRIKVVVGWSIPTLSSILDATSLTAKQALAFKHAIEETKTSLYLQITGHQLNFKDDGALELSIDYVASLDGIMAAKDADIFAGDTTYTAKRKRAEDDQKEAKEDEKKKKEAAKRHRGGEETEDSDTAADDAEDSVLDKANKKVKELASKDRMARYRRFLGILYDKNRIYSVKISADMYQQGLISGQQNPEKRAEMARVRVGKDPAKRGFGEPQQSNNFDSTLMKDLASFSRTKGDTDKNALEGPDEFDKYAELQIKKDDDGSVTVPYFYLGDLIDGIFEYMNHLPVDAQGYHGSLQFLLGAMELIDPLQAFQVKDIELECVNANAKRVIRAIQDVDPLRFSGPGSGITFSINMGSIPISLHSFREWYVQNVVRSNRDKFMLLDFVKQVCASLVIKAFNAVCFQDTIRYHLKFDTSLFDLADSYVGQNATVDEVAASKKKADTLSRTALVPEVRPNIPTVILYSVDSRPRTGDYQEDLEAGIYHYYLGASCGLAKNIKFNRIDFPEMRAARITKDGSLSATQLRELYMVDLDLIGNTLHKTGQYVFIEPIGVGLGSLKAAGTIPNLARILGIGGYHLINSVKSEISDAGFNVSISAQQEGMAFDNNRIISINRWPETAPKIKDKKGKRKKGGEKEEAPLPADGS